MSHPIILSNLAETLEEPALIVTPLGRVAALNASFKARFRVDDEDLCGCQLAGLPREVAQEILFSLPGIDATDAFIAEPLHARDRLVGYCVRVAGDAEGAPAPTSACSCLQASLDALPSGVIVWDPDGALLMANRQVMALYQAFGIELRPGVDRRAICRQALRSGLLGNRYRGLISPTDSFMERWLLEETKNRGSTVTERMSEQRWLKMSTRVLDSGCVVSFYEETVALGTEEGHLRGSTTYFGSILRVLPDFVVHIGTDGRVEFVNDACAEAIGLTPAEVMGKKGIRFFEDAFSGPIQEMIRDMEPGSPAFTFDQRWDKADGEFVWLRWSSKGLFECGKLVGIVATGRDISVEYAQQQALKIQSDELAKKNKSLEQFAAVVSHDLKAPLRHVSVFADMIAEEAEKGNLAEVQAFSQQVRNSAQRMDRIIRRLLEYSQIAYKIVSIGRVNLADIAIQAVQNLESQIEESRAEILLSRLPTIEGDPDLIRHLMQNLIANAVKYSRRGSAPRVRIYAVETGSTINLTVEDNGIGIDPKFADRIFTAFQRLHADDKVYEGFGVGLALCKQIAESHRGTIELDSSYSGGARFIVRLPKSLGL